MVATLHQTADYEIHQGGALPPPKGLRDIDSVVSTPVEDHVRPTLCLTIGRISQDIREDFQIPLLERVFQHVTVDDREVVRQSVDKLLKYLTDENKIPPEYLTDKRVVFWAKLKVEFRASGKNDKEFLQKIHKIWSLFVLPKRLQRSASGKVNNSL